MSLSPETLYPLNATSFTFTYTHKVTLRSIATRYTHPTPKSASSTSCSLVFIPGVSLCQETWIPVIKQLYGMAAKSNGSVDIRSIWVVERPNHGDAGILNAQLLKQHYSMTFPNVEFGAAIRTFLASDILSKEERTNLIGIGHSSGGGSLVLSMKPAMSDLPFKQIILVETPICDRSSEPHFLRIYKQIRHSNSRRRTSWTSKEEAMKWFKTHVPWAGFHPDVIRIISETYLIPDERNPGNITTKTTSEQESAAFIDDGTQLDGGPYLRSILDLLPVHIIQGSTKDIWPPALDQDINKNIDDQRHRLASISVINGVGHYIPVVIPTELAAEIFSILGGQISHAVKSRL